MALDVSTIESKLNSIVSESDSVADVADKWADALRGFVAEVPTVGPEASAAIGFLDVATKALDHLKQSLASA